MKKLAIVTALLVSLSTAFAERDADLYQFADYDPNMIDQQDKGEANTPLPFNPVQLNLASPISILSGDYDVEGLKLDLIYGYSLRTRGLDLGLVSVNNGFFQGLQLAGFTYTDGTVNGFRASCIASYSTKNIYGLFCSGVVNWTLADSYGVEIAPFNFNGAKYGIDIGALNWNSGSMYGGDVGVANVAHGDISGAQIGVFNFCKGAMNGAQIGAFNVVSGPSTGVQIGFFNTADEHTGVQIGILNINVRGVLPRMCIFNANFR